MITSTIRDFTKDEKERLLMRMPGLYKRFESFMLKLIVIVMVLLVPLLSYDHFKPVASDKQAVYCIVIVIISIAIAFWLTKKFEGGFSNSKQKIEIQTGQVEVIKVQTTRAIKREEFEDLGIAYYISVTDMGTQKTLFLCGQYLDKLELEKTFPNTEFEFIRKIGSDEFIEFKTSGQYFMEEKTLPAFDEAAWKNGVPPVNGQLLAKTIDEIT